MERAKRLRAKTETVGKNASLVSRRCPSLPGGGHCAQKGARNRTGPNHSLERLPLVVMEYDNSRRPWPRCLVVSLVQCTAPITTMAMYRTETVKGTPT